MSSIREVLGPMSNIVDIGTTLKSFILHCTTAIRNFHLQTRKRKKMFDIFHLIPLRLIFTRNADTWRCYLYCLPIVIRLKSEENIWCTYIYIAVLTFAAYHSQQILKCITLYKHCRKRKFGCCKRFKYILVPVYV